MLLHPSQCVAGILELQFYHLLLHSTELPFILEFKYFNYYKAFMMRKVAIKQKLYFDQTSKLITDK